MPKKLSFKWCLAATGHGDMESNPRFWSMLNVIATTKARMQVAAMGGYSALKRYLSLPVTFCNL